MTAFRIYLVSLVIAGSFSLCAAPPAAAQPPAQNTFQPYVAVNDYSWTETDIDGSRLMKESGTLVSVGLTYTHLFASQVTLQPAIEFFGGDVDYDGANQVGVPVKSTTRYFGFKFKGDAGYRIPVGLSGSVEPFAGLAVWYWSRTVEDSIAADGTPAFGYTEDWTTFFGRLGLRGGANLSSSVRWFAEGGVKLPIYNENYAHIGDGITLEPGRKISYFAETGLAIRSFTVSVTYDGQRYSQSDPVAEPFSGTFFVQPESKADQYGIKLGWTF